ncbi:hypothetical protein [Dactylosporangium sp. CA-139066]|uniref:hypothetical protein n=1 Tax=Dactylosporangium sp. CA-139066 TaxID=3239930 RepID=UPI003D8B23F1
MIPHSSSPLYAVGEADTHIDLLLVVAWTPLDGYSALPVMLDLHSAKDTARTMAGEHRRITFYDNRELAGIAYESCINKVRQYERRLAAEREDAERVVRLAAREEVPA